MGANDQDDRRVRKTKRALRDGLAELMVTKDIRNITVRELTDKVDIHRATFYAHYKDIYDLYEQMENAVAAELNDLIIQNYEQPATYFYKVIFEYILENKQLCRMLFSTNGEGSFVVRLNDLFEEKCIETWCKDWEHSKIGEELTYHVRYHVQGCLAIISKWVYSGFAYPTEKLVEIISDIDKNMEYAVMKKSKKIN
ncbi:TetR/AcrR family transcriptional regulator [Lacrimispora xylanisolvens]|uniref:TetR/AcrR family transcriptional regulator n=1 Tax=Lacrimispora xylanisolvens TaxID=384636 RepID=UPI002402C5E7|nr:TetR/AcrR family transcriptional regulator [Paenibacillaceae bacterium]